MLMFEIPASQDETLFALDALEVVEAEEAPAWVVDEGAGIVLRCGYVSEESN